jgi:hypothetical protein
MIRRYPTLDDALRDIEGGTLQGVTAITMNREWWQTLPIGAQTEYRRRCARAGVELRADQALSRHFVELVDGKGDSPLDSEHRV